MRVLSGKKRCRRVESLVRARRWHIRDHPAEVGWLVYLYHGSNLRCGDYKQTIPHLPAWPFVDADGVVNHINWKVASGSSITRYISMCSTSTKLDNEKEWRRRKGRSITIFTTDGRNLVWGRIRLTSTMAIDLSFLSWDGNHGR